MVLENSKSKINTKNDNQSLAAAKLTIIFWLGIITAFLLASRGMFFAASTDLGQNIQTTSNNILNEVSTVYCNSIGWLILAISIITLAVSKNDKVIGMAKKVAIGSVIVYVVLKIMASSDSNVIRNSVDTVTNWVSGS